MGKANKFQSEGSIAARNVMDNKKFQNISTNTVALYGFDTPGAPNKGNSALEDKSKLSKRGGKMIGGIGFSNNQTIIISGTASINDDLGQGTIDRTIINIIGESGADTLDTLTGRKYEGQLIVLMNQASPTITLTHLSGSIGNFFCPGRVDFELTDAMTIILIDDQSFGTQTWRVVEVGAGGSSGLSNIVEDTTPQLGGDLDLNGKNIVGVTGERYYFNPNTYMTGSATSGRINVFNNSSNISAFGTFGFVTTNLFCANISTTGEVDVNGNFIYLSPDRQTYIESATDDQFQLVVNSSLAIQVNASTVSILQPINMFSNNITMGTGNIDTSGSGGSAGNINLDGGNINFTDPSGANVAGTISFNDQSGTSKTGGGAAALPALPVSYMRVEFLGADRWIPYYST